MEMGIPNYIQIRIHFYNHKNKIIKEDAAALFHHIDTDRHTIAEFAVSLPYSFDENVYIHA